MYVMVTCLVLAEGQTSEVLLFFFLSLTVRVSLAFILTNHGVRPEWPSLPGGPERSILVMNEKKK